MRLRVFQSEKGDCVLVSSRDGRHLLADGGMAASYTEFASRELASLHRAGEALDVVYVSHIDEDHISGVLQLLDDLVDWRVFEHHGGASGIAPPDSPRPPEIRGIWHNAFHEQISRNRGPVDRQFAADVGAFLDLGARALSGFLDAGDPGHRALARQLGNLATSKRQAIQVSRRIGDDQLDIPLNAPYDGRLMLTTSPPSAIGVGAMTATVIGPFEADLRKLRDDWNDWLRSQQGKRALRAIRRDAREDEERLGASEVETFFSGFDRDAAAQLALELENAERFRRPDGLAARLGRRSRVSTPNLASLMLLLEEDGRSVVMTGDGHWQDVWDGLKTVGKLDANDQIHVDVLKVMHHGSEHNISEEFCQAVIADHYVFCGNGEHENPDLDAVEAIVRSRIAGRNRGDHPDVADRFKLWFNASASVRDPGDRSHMTKLERLTDRLRRQSRGQMRKPFFLGGRAFTLTP